MGLLYLASAIRRGMSAQVSILDARLDRLSGSSLKAAMASYKPDLVGVTSIINEIEGAVEAVGFSKELWPGSPVIMGGPWPSSAPEDALNRTGADLVVRGEGEEAIQEIALRLAEGKTLDNIPGTVARLDGGIIAAGPRPLIEDLDSLPYPAFDALDLSRYLHNWRNSQNRLQRSSRIMPLFTSRGCPFNCIFCHSLYGKRFRPRGAEHVLGEIELLTRRYGVEEIEVSDDIFNFDLNRAKRILSGIIDRRLGIKLSLPNGLRADRTDEEMISLLREAGCTRICYAVESASPRIQKIIGKGIDLEKTFRVIEYTARKGINVGGFFIFGFPGETEEDMEETIRFAVDSALDTASFFYLAPFPGTRLSEQYPQATAARFRDFTDIPINLSAVSDEKFSKIRKKAYRRFYLKGKRIARNWETSPKNWQLIRNIWALSRLFVLDYVRY